MNCSYLLHSKRGANLFIIAMLKVFFIKARILYLVIICNQIIMIFFPVLRLWFKSKRL